MNLGDLKRAMQEYGVSVSLTSEGRLKTTAPQRPPESLVEAIREHRGALIEDLLHPRPSGHSNIELLSQQAGRCGTCLHWTPDAFDDGLCSLGRAAHGWLDGNPKVPVITPPHHQCAAHDGKGWKAHQQKGRA